MPKSHEALEILAAMTKDDPEVQAMLEESSLNAEIAQMIYDARTRAGLTQKQLADRAGTQQSVISQLEDADYDGHSLSMLQTIARALNQREVLVIEDVFAVGGGGGAFLGGDEVGEHGEGGEEGGFHSQSQDGGADQVLAIIHWHDKSSTFVEIETTNGYLKSVVVTCLE